MLKLVCNCARSCPKILSQRLNFSILHRQTNNFPIPRFRNHVIIMKQPWFFNISYRGNSSGSNKKAEDIMKKLIGPPPKDTPTNFGQAALATSSITGLGALCFYALYISKDNAHRVGLWRDFVRDRVRTTYAYFGASVLWTGGATYAAFKTPILMRFMSWNAFVVLGAAFFLQILSGILVINTPYYPGFGLKQLAWITHSSLIGVAIAPLCFIGGPVIVKAFTLTAGVIFGLSVIAYCAPEEAFLSWSAPLAISLGCIFTTSFGSFFLPPSTSIGAGLFAVYLYGGMLVFSMMLLYDTKRIIRQAELTHEDDPRGFDPINAAMSLYMDALNIFVRFVQLLALQEVKKRQDK